MNDNERTPTSCFEDMRPIVSQLIRLTKQAPLSLNGKAGLALLVFAAFRSNAAAALQESDSSFTFERAFAVVGELTDSLAAAKEGTP